MIDGIIKKVFDQWEVESNLVLHDDNVKQIEELSKTFDNIEARVLSFPFIRYEIKDGMAYIPSLDFDKDYPVVEDSKNSIEFFSKEDAKIFFDALDQPDEPSPHLLDAATDFIDKLSENNTNFIDTKPVVTTVGNWDAAYDRTAYMKLINNIVEFDDSNGEYGPIRFNLSELHQALSNHIIQLSKHDRERT